MPMDSRKVDANGLTFAVDAAGEGDTVALLLHGFPESRQSWRGQLGALQALGWRAAAPDLRGYGDSSRPQGKSPYRIEHLVDDVTALFEVLGARRRVLIGHDWGGVIAWRAALRGAPLDGLVILNAPHPATFRRALKSLEQRLKSWYVAYFLLPWLPELMLRRNHGEALAALLRRQSPNFSPELLDILRRNIVQPGAATAMLNYYRANAITLGGPGPWARIEVPTLMIWGENDIALSLSLTEGLEPFVADFTLRRIPEASHWVQQDASAAVNQAIADWARAKGLAPS